LWTETESEVASALVGLERELGMVPGVLV
jgi:hypothetical protein